MKIKLAILEQDQNYLNRIVSVFSTKYSDKLEVYSFTDVSLALSTLESIRIDVFIASDVFKIDEELLPKKCELAYFVASQNIDTVNGHRAICKFQRVDLIYKQILSIYSEISENISNSNLSESNSKTILFISASGGVGSSSMAAACALHFAASGKHTLYLNLEKYGSSDVFFSAEGQFSMSDIIFSLKSKRSNLSIKLESCVKQDYRGVFFYSGSKIALDMFELNVEDIIHLVSELKAMNVYDYIIIDTDFDISQEYLNFYSQTDSIVLVSDGSEISNNKTSRAYNALSVTEQSQNISILSKIVLIYNKFSNKTCRTIEGLDLTNIGGAPRYEHTLSDKVITQLSNMNMFDKLL